MYNLTPNLLFNCRLSKQFIFNKQNNKCFSRFISVSVFNHKFIKKKLTNHSIFDKEFKFNFVRWSHSEVRMMENSINTPTMSVADYDCIGFDLDNTLCEYNLNPLIHMEYSALVNYFCDLKGYPRHAFKMPLLLDDLNFLQRGLLLDLKRGNILKVNYCGTILNAYHGTKCMSEDDIKRIYGESKEWKLTNSFCQDMISTWNGPSTLELRALLDFFDISASFVFAQAVDYLDHSSANTPDSYIAGEEIIMALVHTYRRDHYPNDVSGFFQQMKRDQSLYAGKCDPLVLDWLKQLKESGKITFLLTGSNVDYASFTSEYCLGKNWKELFDIVICYARKPGFFVNNLPFLSLKGFTELNPLKPDELIRDNIYNQGNWNDLYIFFSKLTGKEKPKCLYFGDNVVQDIYTPARFCGCDTVAVIEELNSEHSSPDAYHWLKSDKWGSYFKYDNNTTVWGNAIISYAKICIPSLKYISKFPLNTKFQTFSQIKNDVRGFHPVIPPSLK